MSRFSGPLPPRYGWLAFSVFRRRHNVLKSGAAQSNPANRKRRSAKPVVCRIVRPNRTFIVRQVWIAAPLNFCWRPRLPLGGGSQPIFGSNQFERDPRCFSAVL
ncbi:hypothetical protein METH_17870 [Leisingera methylohalidivorans DSM 14336]|uniref:Uncharacterized protein n=1 Tax=Leisingera methylohalidivorans DSM 14336 TaxID=999552 RepID=V9VZS3_9RHOB|nr:hypothetical protein METH_17870 [Leisingera methylohalidivorans DSM 14336]